MKCPFCSYDDDKVIDSRPAEEGTVIRRRRECTSCHRRYTTYEKVEKISLVVIKKNGSRQPYERGKVEKSILRACEKRKCTADDLENLANDVENGLYNLCRKEITTEEIGNLIMKKLKDFDEVAYIRFASVYKEFGGIEDFIKEVDSMRNLEKNKDLFFHLDKDV